MNVETDHLITYNRERIWESSNEDEWLLDIRLLVQWGKWKAIKPCGRYIMLGDEQWREHKYL